MRMRVRRSPTFQSRSAVLFGAAFALLFLAVGALLVLFAVWSVQDGDTESVFVFGAFGSTFCTAAVGALATARRDRRAHLRDLERKDHFPDQPWRWYDEWARGRVASHGRAKMILFWLVALFWSAVVGSMFFAGLSDFQQGSPVLMGFIPFGAISLLFYFWAIRATWRWKKYGSSFLALDTFPGVMLEADTLIMYDLELVRTNGNRLTVGIFIPSKSEAGWLAQRMRDALEGR